MPIKIVLVDDHRIVRDGLRALLQPESDFVLVAEAEEGRTGVNVVAELDPDVVVMDISMPDLNGVDATRQIKSNRPETQVLILTAHADQKMAIEAMKAGATGLLPKDVAFAELAVAIRAIVAGKTYLSPHLHGEIVEAILRAPTEPGAEIFSLLTPREREVLQLMAEGNATKMIAHQLDLSIKTIETYRRAIMEKVGIDNVAELTKYAVREGLTSL